MLAKQFWIRLVAWFLAVGYGIGAPLTAVLEARGQTLSQRFDLPPSLIYLTCALQIVCAVGVLVPRLAPLSGGLLTVVTLGAIGAHLRIGQPLTSLTAIAFTVIQVWFVLASRERDRRRH